MKRKFCTALSVQTSAVNGLPWGLCRLSLDTKVAGKFGEPHIPEAAAAVGVPASGAADGSADSSTGGRSLLQGVNTNDFTCVGCPAGGPDTRTSVPSTSSFPFSAIGQLMGQVTSNTCASYPTLLNHDLFTNVQCCEKDFQVCQELYEDIPHGAVYAGLQTQTQTLNPK